MPQGDKSKYTDKQKRQAEHIEEGYRERGISEKEAESRAWATVNKQDGGGKKPGGSGHGKAKKKATRRKHATASPKKKAAKRPRKAAKKKARAR